MTYAYTNPADDKRYKTPRWKGPHGSRLRTLRRDGYRCWAMQEQKDGTLIPCPVRATVADHIVPSSLDMPDHEFYSLSNLRASCKRHNTARGVSARLDRETSKAGTERPPRSRSYGGLMRPRRAF